MEQTHAYIRTYMEQTHVYIRIYIAQAWSKHTYTYVYTWSKHTYTCVYTLRKHGAKQQTWSRLGVYHQAAKMEQTARLSSWSRLRVYHPASHTPSIILHHTHLLERGDGGLLLLDHCLVLLDQSRLLLLVLRQTLRLRAQGKCPSWYVPNPRQGNGGKGSREDGREEGREGRREGRWVLGGVCCVCGIGW